jgi:NADPH:quinone reductase
MILPKIMNIIALDGFGGSDVLRLETRNVPEPCEGEVLIKVSAAGINRPDIFQRKGLYLPPKDAPDYLGLEVAGIIAKIGRGVSRYKIGDRVCALLAGGGYAEYAIAKCALTLPSPHSMSDIEAAALPESVFTVWSCLFDIAKLKKGEWVLIHGGTSGIGITAIQMAKAFGARVIVTAGSHEKCAICVSIGAEYAINYREDDFVSAIKTVTNGVGVHVILDMVGGDYTAKNYEVAAMDARIVQIATLRGAKTQIDLGQIMRKRLWHTGATLRPRSLEEKAHIAIGVEKHIWPFIEQGVISPIIHKVFALHQAAEAHQCLENGILAGKIMLSTGSLAEF